MLIFHARHHVLRAATSLAIAPCLLISVASLYPHTAWAQTAAKQPAAAIAQSFEVSGNTEGLAAGSLVSATPRKIGIVELASVDNAQGLVGVVAKDPLLTIVDNANSVSVVTAGKAEVLVSDINGALKSGDRVTASPIAGIGMKATLDAQVVGAVQADQSSDKHSLVRTIKDSTGKSHDVKISTLPLQIGVTYYQLPGSSFLPPFVQRTANNIAGQPVSLVRILLVSTILISSLISIISLLYASGHSSIVAIGRNPLSANAVYKGMYRVGVLAVIILVFGTGTSYLLLKL